MGDKDDTAIWFVWNRKTTLSVSKKRKLIGDDEHGWTSETPFLILVMLLGD
jgi:phosphoenolpyruvate carboxykinase (ATP)